MKKKLKTIRGVSVSNKRVIYRVAYDFKLRKKGGKFEVNDDLRICTSLPTLKYLVKNKAKIVILTWLGRPEKKEEKFRLDPVARRLTELLHHPVKKLDESAGPAVEKEIEMMKPGEIIMLENIRFYPGEQKADPQLSKRLARLGDLIVNDAFAQVHRKAASLAPLQKLLPTYAGFHLAKEINELTSLFEKPKKPKVAIIGGVKVSTRLGLIDRLRKNFDYILLGGALANTIFAAQGKQVGRSLIEEEMVAILQSKEFLHNNIIIPIDVIVSTGISKQAKDIQRAVGNVKKGENILDIGPDTNELYRRHIKEAKMIVWNGPMGYFEEPAYSRGTKSVARAIAKSKAISIIGGGETISAIRSYGLEKKFSFVSTGGGAMLHFLEGKPMPGLNYIKKVNK
ncbi:MAG: phosphoglycerate kinase [Patescibacteria group bacterium]